MVIREPEQHEDFFLKVDGRWLRVTKEVLAWHPGGNAVLTYKNKDASTVFHTFHAGSKTAYRKLAELQKAQGQQEPVFEVKDLTSSELYDVNMGRWDMSAEKAAEVSRSFDRLRVRVREMGLLEGDHLYYARKFTEAVGLILLSFYLQWHCLYVASALVIGLAWQQLGWMIHEYCHHQHFKVGAQRKGRHPPRTTSGTTAWPSWWATSCRASRPTAGRTSTTFTTPPPTWWAGTATST